MSAFTVRITAYVVASYPTPAYSAPMQTAIIAIMENAAASVSPVQWANLQSVTIEQLIASDATFNLLPQSNPEYLKLLLALQYAVNLAIGDYTVSGGAPLYPLGTKIFQGMLFQNGVADPTVQVTLNDFVGLAYTYTSQGRYAISPGTPGEFTLNKTFVSIGQGGGAGTYTDIVQVSASKITVSSDVEKSDILTGVISGTPTDSLLVKGVALEIIVLP
jgi:hypothetical protein